MGTLNICWSITKAGSLENTLFFLFLPRYLNFAVLSRKASFYTWLHFRPPLWAGWKCGSKNDSSPDSLDKLLLVGASWPQMLFEMTKSIRFNKVGLEVPQFSLTFSALAQARKQHTVLGRILKFCSLVWLSNDVTKKENVYKKSTFFKDVFNGKKASCVPFKHFILIDIYCIQMFHLAPEGEILSKSKIITLFRTRKW